MTTIKRFAFSLVMAAALPLASAQAQRPSVSTVNVTPEADRVRVAAVGEVYDLKLEVVDESGDAVFEAAQGAAGQVIWGMTDSAGRRVPPGTYTVTASYVTASGKQRKRIEQVLVTAHSGEGGVALPTPEAGAGPAPQAPATITGEGIANKIPKFTGTYTIGNSIMTEAGAKIGIGTVSPTSRLTVVGGTPTVISAINTSVAAPGNSGITGTGGTGTSSTVGHKGGAGVIGKGGKGGQTSSFGSPNGAGGDGVLGMGGEGADGTPQGSGGTGVRGIGGSTHAIGVHGSSESGLGVLGHATNGTGLSGQTHTGKAVSGYSFGSGFAGHFTGKVEILGNTAMPKHNLSFGSMTRQMINLWSTSYAIGVQSSTQYYRTGGGFAWFKGGTHSNTQNDPGSNGFLQMRLDANGNLFTTGAVNPVSDRNLKANFSAVNAQAILRRLASVPIQTWSYKADGDSVRHIGPVAQDFKAAFELGADDKTIATVDADGVTMAAVQGLYQLMLEKDRQIARQNQRIERLQAQLDQVRRSIKRRPAARR